MYVSKPIAQGFLNILVCIYVLDASTQTVSQE